MKIIYLSFSIVFFFSQAFASNVDYNTNGVTDFHLYGTNDDGTNIDHGIFLDDGNTKSTTFGNKKTDKIISGDFNGDNKADVGIIRVKNNKLLWRYKDIDTGLYSGFKTFGSGSVKALSGCDFNGNGKTEIAFIDGKKLYFKDFGGKKRTINLPRNGYTYYYCADVNGDGKDEFIGKKKGVAYLNGDKGKNLWGYDVVTRGSKVLVKQKAFGNFIQGGIVVADIDGDGKDNIGYIKNESDKAFFVFLNQINGNDTTQYYIPRVVNKTGKFFDISRAFFSDGIGFIYKGADKNIYKYNLTTGSDTTFILSLSTPSNIKSGTLVKDIGIFNIKGSSSSDDDSSSNISVDCDVTRGVGNGFLWKGRSESNGLPVALLPIYTKASECSVVASNNSRSDAMGCSAQSDNPYNGVGRQHWRAKVGCSTLKTPSVLRCKVGSQWQCWTISNPCQSRIE